MELVLSNFGTSFATREKARQVASTLRATEDHDEIRVALGGVTASPSFMAELLTQLSLRYVRLSFEGGSEHLRGVTFSLVDKLGLRGRVRSLTAN